MYHDEVFLSVTVREELGFWEFSGRWMSCGRTHLMSNETFESDMWWWTSMAWFGDSRQKTICLLYFEWLVFMMYSTNQSSMLTDSLLHPTCHVQPCTRFLPFVLLYLDCIDSLPLFKSWVIFQDWAGFHFLRAPKDRKFV